MLKNMLNSSFPEFFDEGSIEQFSATQVAISLYNRATCLTAGFASLVSREEFIHSFFADGALYSSGFWEQSSDNDGYIFDLEQLWKRVLFHAECKKPKADSPAFKAVLEIGMSVVLHRAQYQKAPSILFEAQDLDSRGLWGICMSIDGSEAEVWEVSCKEEFLVYVGERK